MSTWQDRCDVWVIDLDAQPEETVYIDWLDPQERERWQRLHFPLHRRRFLLAHALMRRILAGYLDASPQEIAFDADENGRPRLAPDSRWAGALDFNLSHSEGLALFAVTPTGPVGIDVEMLRPIPEAHMLARRYFAPAECAEVEALVGPGADAAFLTCWTRKEAVLKSLGVGLRFDPRRIIVGTRADDSELSLVVSDSDTSLRVKSFRLFGRAVGACATPGEVRTLRMCEMNRQLPQPFC